MELALNPHVTSNLASSVRATHARTEVSAKKVGIDSSATAPALASGHALVREVNMCDGCCMLSPVMLAFARPFLSSLTCYLLAVCYFIYIYIY